MSSQERLSLLYYQSESLISVCRCLRGLRKAICVISNKMYVRTAASFGFFANTPVASMKFAFLRCAIGALLYVARAESSVWTNALLGACCVCFHNSRSTAGGSCTLRHQYHIYNESICSQSCSVCNWFDFPLSDSVLWMRSVGKR